MSTKPEGKDQIAPDDTPKFVPTPEMLLAAENMVAAMAFLEVVKPVVLAYQKKILAVNRWPFSAEWVARGLHDAGDVVLDPSDSYLLGDAHSKLYFAACHQERDAANLKVDHPDKCPLLVAENICRKTRIVLIDVMEPSTKMNHEMLSASADCVGNINKVTDLCMQLLVPYLDKGKTMAKFVKNPV